MPAQLSPEQILKHVEKVLASEVFRNADQVSRLFRFLVNAALDKRPVSERTIATDAFEKSDFDPLVDGSVRAAARHLRTKLVQYYDSERHADPIRIEIPKGYGIALRVIEENIENGIEVPLRSDTLPVKRETLNVPARLLSFVWSYPLTGKSAASWAVKESLVLKGDLDSARKQPALGVAIVTTELALAAFGQAAGSRVDGCISWGVARAQRELPYQILVEVREPSDDALEQMRTDFRHTLAFGVILARARKQYSYLKSYLDLVLKKQERNGGWPRESATTISPVFTAFYAVELLHLALSDPAIPHSLRADITAARTRGLRWLMKNRIRPRRRLWSSGALREFAWDGVLGTAWVLHRLTCTADVALDDWRCCLDDALSAMIESALSPETWAGSSEDQRYRVEARVAAAVSRAKRMKQLSSRSQEQARLYAGAWKARAENWVNRLPTEQMDVSTAAFLVWSLVADEKVEELGRSVLFAESTQEPSF